jgi:seryl-tRNA synthetase
MTHEANENRQPFLKVSRFLVFKDNQTAYDQTFKLGVNIIRGDNGTGKSTVIDLLYYGLGAEVTEWTVEQAKCSSTVVEVMLNYKTFCLRREITDTGRAPMFIHEGDVKSAHSEAATWYRYPFSRSAEKHSFSQQLFNLLGLPSHKTDESRNLTMHQILRLMYVDQLSPTTKLLKEEKKGDNESIRRAIGEYLLGIDDLEAHNLRQELIASRSIFDKADSELRAIYRFVGSTNSILRREILDEKKASVLAEIAELESRKRGVRSERIDVLNDKVKMNLREIVLTLDKLTLSKVGLEDRKSEITSEFVDTVAFIESLQLRLKALEQSQVTNETIGELYFRYCPACLTPLQPDAKEGHCGLCNTDLANSQRHYAYIQMSIELNFQIKESKKLVESFQAELDIIASELPNVSQNILTLRREYQDLTSNADLVDARISELSTTIGLKRGQVIALDEKREMIDQIEGLVKRKEEAQTAINFLSDMLQQIEARTASRHNWVYSHIEEIAKELIRRDGGYESVFEDPDDVMFDFSRDKMSVNGRSKFSASSMTVLKNAVRLAIFLHCVEDEVTRLPRFFMMDNIEDKGMTPPRSQNFQREIVAACDALERDYQLIFTTSMIDPALNQSDYVVGPFYPKGEHTLKFV